MKRFLWVGPVLALVLITACQNVFHADRGASSASPAGGAKAVSGMFGNSYVLPYSPYDYEVQLAKFAPADANGNSTVIGSDRKLNSTVWANANSSPVRNFKHPSNAAGPNAGYSTEGTLRSLWDGYTLYLAVEVADNTPSNLTALTSTTQRMTSPGNNTWNNFDAVEFDIDFFNDKIDKWELDDGMVKVSRNGKLAGNRLNGNGDETWADPFGQPEAREFTDRLKDWYAYEITGGYTVWLAIEIYAGADPQNGMAFGIDVMIQDSPSNNAARSGRTYWSHNTDSYRFNSMDGNLDWGCIVLDGHTGDNSNFAKSDWMLTNPIRWAKGERWTGAPGAGWWPPTSALYLINLPDTVSASWETASWNRLQQAVTGGQALLTQTDSWGRPHVNWSTATQAQVKAAALAVEAAIAGLRWADDILGATDFDAPRLNTLPDPMVFKTDGNFGNGAQIPGLQSRKGTAVNSYEDWKLRVREIKALAALYEYGPIPDAPKTHSVTIQSTPEVPAHWEHPGWWIVGGQPRLVDVTPAAYSLTATYTYDGTERASWDGTADTKITTGITVNGGTKQDAYTFSFPTEADKQANGITGAVPVVLSFTGSTQDYLRRGIATVNVPTSVTTDARSNTVWSIRGGTFRNFYPYVRGQRYEISNEMAAAWGASRAADALYDAAEMDLYHTPISITNITSSADFTLGDMVSADGITWWTVGQIDAAETVAGQSGTNKIKMLYLAAGAIPPTTGGNPVVFTQFRRMIGNGVYENAIRGNAQASITIGASAPTGKKMKDVVDYQKIATDGFSINGKYAFVSAVFDERINLAIPGAAGATGPQTWRYDARGNEYSWGAPGGAELIADNVLHNPGRTNEVFRRFLSHFRWYQPLRGIDANGDISHGFAERLPFDNHELVAALYPRAIIERNTFNDYNDGSEADAISMQAALLVYRHLIAKSWGEHKTPAGRVASAEDLIKFNYRATGGHGSDPIQAQREAQYMAWYFYDKPMNNTFASHLNTDPFLNDVLVSGGSNSYERHYGGLKMMMPWPWAGPYYPK